VGVVVTPGDALGDGVGSVGEAPNADEASPAAITRLSRIEVPKRITRDDDMPTLLADAGHAHAHRAIVAGRKLPPRRLDIAETPLSGDVPNPKIILGWPGRFLGWPQGSAN
jgi:hypothetical protein